MATVNFIPCKKQNAFSMRNEIEYILQDFKVCIEPEKLNCDHTVNYQTYSENANKTGCIHLISGKDCCPETAFQEFMVTKNSFKKADQTMFYHYDQAFKDGETISPKTAHEIAAKFAEDMKLHDNRYLKEMMEREFELRRTQATELKHRLSRSSTYTAAADIPALSADIGKAGQPVLQPERDLGWDSPAAGANKIPPAAKPQSQDPAGQSTCEVGAGANQQKSVADTADIVTGWEQERALFFSAEAAAAAPDVDAAVDSHSPDLVGIGGSVVQLGRALERLDNPVPIKDATTKPQQHTGRKKKLAVGQKEDDHSGHDFEMKM